MADRPRLLPRSWPWVIPLVMIVATEYKLRVRPLGDATSGSLDPQVLAELGVYAIAGAYLLNFARPPRIRQLQPVMFALWAYVLVTAASSLYSANRMEGLARGAQLVIIGGLIQAVASRATRAQMHMFAQGFVALVTGSVLFGFVVKYPPVLRNQAGRFTWLYVHPDIAGSFLAIAITAGVAYTVLPRPTPGVELWPRWLTAVMTAILSIGLVLTQVRGSLVTAALAVSVVIVITRPRRRRPETFVTLMTVGAVIAVVTGSIITEFLSRGQTAQQLSTLSNRTVLWSLAWQDFLHSPLFGYGMTSARTLFTAVGLANSHNAFINVIIDVGLIGLVAWISLLVCIAVAVRRAYAGPFARCDVSIIAGVFVCLLANSLTVDGIGAGVSVSAIWLFMLAAWLMVLRREPPESPVAAERQVRRVEPLLRG